MASEDVPRQEFVIRNLQTRSVTLYPSKAQITREITGISLQPGPNEIVIIGLTPTTDESSIKVDGTGAATITDLTTELVDNKEVFDDIYLEDDDEDEEISDVSILKEDDKIVALNAEIKKMNISLNDQNERYSSATSRLAMLEKYGSDASKIDASNLKEFIRAYTEEREKVYQDGKDAQEKISTYNTQIDDKNTEVFNLRQAAIRARARADKEDLKEAKKRERKRQEVAEEKARIRAERIKFWPKKVYKVTITLDAPSGETPAVSRRGSMESLVKVASPSTFTPGSETNEPEINLLLSYITYAARWTPRYDLSLNTVAANGILDYCAELSNFTSETWRDAKVVLSTSQTTFQGLDDAIPVLQPWHVRLGKANGHVRISGALESQHEQSAKLKNSQKVPAQVNKPRHEIFGIGNSHGEYHQPYYGMVQQPAQHQGQAVQYMQQPEQRRSQPAGLFDAAMPSASFGVMRSAAPPAPSAPVTMFKKMGGGGRSREAEAESDNDDVTFVDESPAILFEESSFEESGMTTTYDLPNLKTLAPKSTVSKHKITRIEFKGIIFSHILVPKLRASAFLKARLRNATKIALLKGTAGLTLDGSFLGQSLIPRVSAGDSFSLALGVDPTINVSYAKPTVRRSQSGIFNKEDSEVFTRTAIVTNTRNNAMVELTVLDQVPVSEDERLRIEVISPRGVRVGGAEVGQVGVATVPDSNARISVYGDDGAKNSGSGRPAVWGSATCLAKKEGEIVWKVKINPARGCPVNLTALQDYQMQLMLLEQQNKKRLMICRQEPDATG